MQELGSSDTQYFATEAVGIASVLAPILLSGKIKKIDERINQINTNLAPHPTNNTNNF